MQSHPFTRQVQIYASSSSGVEVFSGILQPNIPVAIKETQQPTLEDANSAIQEAMTQKGLNHPAICKVYYCFVEQSGDSGALKTVLLVELMEGDLMKEVEKRAPTGATWPEWELMGYLRTIVEALSYAQQMGVSHRDIKPQNLFISQKYVKVGDFGSSHQTYGSSNFMTKTLQGSPLFLSPELKAKYAKILQGLPANDAYDPFRSDVYSLGMTMAFLARLKPPAELLNLANIQQGTPLVCGEIQRNYPQLGQFIERMLNIDPGRVNFVELEQLLVGQGSFSSTIPCSPTVPVPYSPASRPTVPIAYSPTYSQAVPVPYSPTLPYSQTVQLPATNGSPLQPPPFTAPHAMPPFTTQVLHQAFSAPMWQGNGQIQPVQPCFRYCLVCGHQVLPSSAHRNFCSQKCIKKGPQCCQRCRQRPVTTLAWLGTVPGIYQVWKNTCYQYCSLSCFLGAIPTVRCFSCGQLTAQYVHSKRGGKYCMQCSDRYRAHQGS